ncbi:hypothetical protein [Tessaracoccus coleopterorum]|nr:hypothetical protein [Tessaracoccus coleopterorum]
MMLVGLTVLTVLAIFGVPMGHSWPRRASEASRSVSGPSLW